MKTQWIKPLCTYFSIRLTTFEYLHLMINLQNSHKKTRLLKESFRPASWIYELAEKNETDSLIYYQLEKFYQELAQDNEFKALLGKWLYLSFPLLHA